MKIVCDTNVLVSGSLFGGHPREILRLVAQGTISNHVSPAIFYELENVLLRPKFGLTPNQVIGILQVFRNLFTTVIPTVEASVIDADPDDNRILEAALAAKAEFIISGDKALLDLKTWKNIRIVAPAEFVKEIIGQKP